MSDDPYMVSVLRKCYHIEKFRFNKILSEKEKQDFIAEELARHPLCMKCWNVKKRQINAHNYTVSCVKGLIPLEGTAKERRWAYTLRNNMIKKYSKDDSASDVLETILKIPFANFWILYRNIPIDKIRKEMKTKNFKYWFR